MLKSIVLATTRSKEEPQQRNLPSESFYGDALRWETGLTDTRDPKDPLLVPGQPQEWSLEADACDRTLCLSSYYIIY